MSSVAFVLNALLMQFLQTEPSHQLRLGDSDCYGPGARACASPSLLIHLREGRVGECHALTDPDTLGTHVIRRERVPLYLFSFIDIDYGKQNVL